MKYILILALIIFLIYKLGSFFYRIGAASQHYRQYQDQQKKASSSQNGSSSKSRDGKIKGGEYVDYEEVK